MITDSISERSGGHAQSRKTQYQANVAIKQEMGIYATCRQTMEPTRAANKHGNCPGCGERHLCWPLGHILWVSVGQLGVLGGVYR